MPPGRPTLRTRSRWCWPGPVALGPQSPCAAPAPWLEPGGHTRAERCDACAGLLFAPDYGWRLGGGRECVGLTAPPTHWSRPPATSRPGRRCCCWTVSSLWRTKRLRYRAVAHSRLGRPPRPPDHRTAAAHLAMGGRSAARSPGCAGCRPAAEPRPPVAPPPPSARPACPPAHRPRRGRRNTTRSTRLSPSVMDQYLSEPRRPHRHRLVPTCKRRARARAPGSSSSACVSRSSASLSISPPRGGDWPARWTASSRSSVAPATRHPPRSSRRPGPGRWRANLGLASMHLRDRDPADWVPWRLRT
jgi:hypothetical protein